MNILCIFGTRPEAIKLAPVVLRLRELATSRDDVCVQVCVTGQHREMLDQVLGLFGIEPDIDLDLMSPDQPLAQLTAQAVVELDRVVGTTTPDEAREVIDLSLDLLSRRLPDNELQKTRSKKSLE